MANERSSGTAFFSSKDEKSVLAGAHDYFVNNVLPSDIKACVRKIKAPTLYVNNHDETFLLVRSGHGTLTVNGLDYRLRPNTLINLGPFHRYRYLPDDGEVLEIADEITVMRGGHLVGQTTPDATDEVLAASDFVRPSCY